MITFGFQPIDIDVALQRDTDFVTVLINTEGSWPVGITIVLRFTGPTPTTPTTWAASIAAEKATFDESAAAVNLLLDSGARTARLVYTAADGTILGWSRGGVRAY